MGWKSTEVSVIDTLLNFGCNFGYRISALSPLRCLVNQTWNGTAPTCEGNKNKRSVWEMYCLQFPVELQLLPLHSLPAQENRMLILSSLISSNIQTLMNAHLMDTTVM